MAARAHSEHKCVKHNIFARPKIICFFGFIHFLHKDGGYVLWSCVLNMLKT